LDYMARVESTMTPYGGRWLVHGTTPQVREGDATGDVVLIGFPDLERARAWYESPEYQEIIDLRTRNTSSSIALLEGVPPGYSTHDTISALRAALPTPQVEDDDAFVPPGYQTP